MSTKYRKLKRANLTYEYLDTNSTTHEFLFGALAELVDNSRDAGAENLYIDTIYSPELRGQYILSFRDDGAGMSPDEAADVIQFGKSIKKDSEIGLIGQYGNGLKSGSWRIGKEVILFTKKNGVCSIILISSDFHTKENIQEIIVPLPSFQESTFLPWIDKDVEDPEYAKEQHNLEVEVILKYSPFKTKNELFANFDKIKSNGTIVMIHTLKLDSETGLPELDFESDPEDILMRNFEVDYSRKGQLEHKSFRAYVSILYSNPKMQTFIRGKKVRTRLLERSLYLPIMYQYSSKAFKSNAQEDVRLAERALSVAKNTLDEDKSSYAQAGKVFDSDKSKHKELIAAKRKMECSEKMYKEKIRILEKRKKDMNSFKSMDFIFGINIESRNADGLFIYNCNRLIIMFEPSKLQSKGSKDYRGIMGIVNVPYFVMNPTHNKQQFQNSSEQKSLISTLSEHMEQYLSDINQSLDQDFWSKFGYLNSVVERPLNDDKFVSTRYKYCRPFMQCSKCLKWRMVKFHPKIIKPDYFKDDWQCSDNTDPNADTCLVEETFDGIKLGEFVKKQTETNFNTIETSNPPAKQIKAIQKQNNFYSSLTSKPTATTSASAIQLSTSNSKPPSSASSSKNNERLDQRIVPARATASAKVNYVISDEESDKKSNNKKKVARKRKTDDVQHSSDESSNSNDTNRLRKNSRVVYNHEPVVTQDNNEYLQDLEKAYIKTEPELVTESDIYTEHMSDIPNKTTVPPTDMSTPKASGSGFAQKTRTLVNQRHSFESSTVNLPIVSGGRALDASPQVKEAAATSLLENVLVNYKQLMVGMSRAVNDNELAEALELLNHQELMAVELDLFFNKFKNDIPNLWKHELRRKSESLVSNLKRSILSRIDDPVIANQVFNDIIKETSKKQNN